MHKVAVGNAFVTVLVAAAFLASIYGGISAWSTIGIIIILLAANGVVHYFIWEPSYARRSFDPVLAGVLYVFAAAAGYRALRSRTLGSEPLSLHSILLSLPNWPSIAFFIAYLTAPNHKATAAILIASAVVVAQLYMAVVLPAKKARPIAR